VNIIRLRTFLNKYGNKIKIDDFLEKYKEWIWEDGLNVTIDLTILRGKLKEVIRIGYSNGIAIIKDNYINDTFVSGVKIDLNNDEPTLNFYTTIEFKENEIIVKEYENIMKVSNVNKITEIKMELVIDNMDIEETYFSQKSYFL